jgi:aspartate-semialdehyde dehydrogenase
MPAGRGTFHRVAIVGASSLRGKELKQVLEDRNFPASDVVLLDESVMAGTLTEAAGEPTFIRALEEDSFEGARFAFFAGTPADAQRNWRAAQRAGATVIDLTGALVSGPRDAESPTEVIASIPSLAPMAALKNSPEGKPSSRGTAYSSPGAAVIIVCTLAMALARLDPRRVALILFPPVSERDQAGIEELESQTASLLSFREITRPVFDAQVAFNLLSRYGQDGKPHLADLRAAIARETADYLAGRALVPAIQLVQAPVFYGYSFSAYAEFAPAVKPEEIEAALAGAGAKIADQADAAPTNVSIAGEGEIHMARVESDPSLAGGVWLWGVADNLRLAATNAVRIAEEIVAKSPE